MNDGLSVHISWKKWYHIRNGFYQLLDRYIAFFGHVPNWVPLLLFVAGFCYLFFHVFNFYHLYYNAGIDGILSHVFLLCCHTCFTLYFTTFSKPQNSINLLVCWFCLLCCFALFTCCWYPPVRVSDSMLSNIRMLFSSKFFLHISLFVVLCNYSEIRIVCSVVVA